MFAAQGFHLLRRMESGKQGSPIPASIVAFEHLSPGHFYFWPLRRQLRADPRQRLCEFRNRAFGGVMAHQFHP